MRPLAYLIFSYPRGFAPRTPRHRRSLAASPLAPLRWLASLRSLASPCSGSSLRCARSRLYRFALPAVVLPEGLRAVLARVLTASFFRPLSSVARTLATRSSGRHGLV